MHIIFLTQLIAAHFLWPTCVIRDGQLSAVTLTLILCLTPTAELWSACAYNKAAHPVIRQKRCAVHNLIKAAVFFLKCQNFSHEMKPSTFGMWVLWSRNGSITFLELYICACISRRTCTCRSAAPYSFPVWDCCLFQAFIRSSPSQRVFRCQTVD